MTKEGRGKLNKLKYDGHNPHIDNPAREYSIRDPARSIKCKIRVRDDTIQKCRPGIVLGEARESTHTRSTSIFTLTRRKYDASVEKFYERDSSLARPFTIRQKYARENRGIRRTVPSKIIPCCPVVTSSVNDNHECIRRSVREYVRVMTRKRKQNNGCHLRHDRSDQSFLSLNL